MATGPIFTATRGRPTPPRPPRALLVALLVGFLLLVVGPALVDLATDWLWFRELGYTTVFARTMGARWGIGLAATAFTFALLYGNLRYAQRGVAVAPPASRFAPSADVAATVRRVALPFALLVALTSGLGLGSAWETILAWRYATPFGVADPVFGRDVGYYVFTLPAADALLSFVSGLLVVALLAITAIYWLRGDLIVTQRGLRIAPAAGWHAGLLGAGALLLTAAEIWLVRIPSLLLGTQGRFAGANYADLAARLPALQVLAVVALLGAAFVLVGAARRRVLWHAALAAGAYVLVGIVGAAVVPAVVQRFVVDPNELARETPQLRHHLAAARDAWRLDGVETRELSGEASLTMADLESNSATIENVRLWDREPLLQTLGQLQEIRTYYDFVEVDDDRYRIDGRYRQVMLSPRELNPASLPTRNFINERLTFTHGMGITLSPVNETTNEGLPVLFVKDLPPASTVPLRVTRPQIYYGELDDHWVVTNTTQREFDFPSGDENVFTTYQGRGGVPIGGLVNRTLYAAQFGAMKLLLSDAIGSESRILYRRNVLERASRLYPLLRFDGDPYLVVREDGTLTWMLDAYTTSEHYPYSIPLGDGTRYMRNSVKVAVDAYHGSVTAWIVDPQDPIAQTMARTYPGTLQPFATMPADLRAHLRYPEDLFRVQAELYSVYHMDNPEEFYHREDQWQIPRLGGEGDASRPFLRHIIMRLPDEPEAEYIFMTPFTPRGKDNLAAWMVARMDGEHYGGLRVYRFPKQSLVFGPQQVINRINQDTEVSRQISLWDQRGSEVIRGELLVIPIEEALLYVQPLYLRASGGRIPELKRVIAAYENQVVMEETLDEALERLFAPGAAVLAAAPATGDDDAALSVAVSDADADAGSIVAPSGAPTGAVGTAGAASAAPLVREAAAAYDAAVNAQRVGDWARYGRELERLGRALRQLQAGAPAAGAQPAGSAP